MRTRRLLLCIYEFIESIQKRAVKMKKTKERQRKETEINKRKCNTTLGLFNHSFFTYHFSNIIFSASPKMHYYSHSFSFFFFVFLYPFYFYSSLLFFLLTFLPLFSSSFLLLILFTLTPLYLFAFLLLCYSSSIFANN